MNLLDSRCEEYCECVVEIARCKRLLAFEKKHIRSVWRQDANEINDALNESLVDDEKEPDEDFEDVNANYKEEAIKSFVEILSNLGLMARIISHFDLGRQNLLSKLALEYAECKGNTNKEQCFASLALYQYAISRKELLDFFIKACDSNHPDLLRRMQVERAKTEFKSYSSPEFPKMINENEKKLFEDSNGFKNINASFNFTEEIKKTLPHSSGYLILQFSQNMQSLYVGFAKVDKDQKYEYYLTKLTLSDSIIEELNAIKERIVSLHSYMYKTPITIQEDLDIIEKDAEEELQSIISQTQDFLKPVFSQLDGIINPVIEEKEGEEDKEAPPEPKKGKDAAKDNKKGAKDELPKYESNLPLPTSGIESMVLLLDSRLSSLPIEACEIFKSIPVLTRDFSLHMYTNRLMNLGHKAELHNNNGIAKDSIKYIYDVPKSISEKFKEDIIDQHTKLVQGSTWSGVETSDHIPSDGEWQRMLKESSLFTYFSLTCLLHVYSPEKLSETISIANTNAAIILDRMNSFKPLINKDVLISEHFREQDQPEQTAALLSIMGLNSVLINQWAICPEENMRIYKHVLEEMGVNGKYIGASVQRHEEKIPETIETQENQADEVIEKKVPRKAIYRLNTICYGVPLNRIS